MQSSTRPLISIVSITYNRCQDVLALLDALREQVYSPMEIIVIDNASTDGAAQSIRERFPEVNLIQNHENTGMAAYNTGIQKARGQYILLIDDDGLPTTTDWVDQMVSHFENNPKLGAIACKIRLAKSRDLAPDNPLHLIIQDGFEGFPCPAFVCTGAGIRASALKSVGFFPESFFIDYMEFTLSAKLWDAGWQVRYFPDIEVLHNKSLDAYQRNRAYEYWGLRNYFWFVWMLYPWPAVLEETIHHAMHSLRMVLSNRYSIRVWLRALVDAIVGYRAIAQHRQPISGKTLGWFYQLRGHRRPPFFHEARLGKAIEYPLSDRTNWLGQENETSD